MARIHLDGVGHSYDGGRTYALQPADTLFEDGRTYALLGPSGCGKTTMLNIVSGLLFPSDGRVRLGERDVTRAAIADRNIAQVFQFPVVYRSKTVFGNLAFPLKCRNWDKPRIERRVSEVAELLGLTARLGRSARSLTADEKQLISLGRGLVRDDVAALLMDEPLTVIDPQMKFDLRRRIKQANERTRHTVIYVTHDQNEAMTFADEILVMQAGRVIQRGAPAELFERPLNTYVGTFIGSPGMNFLPATQEGATVLIGDAVIRSDVRAPVDGTLTVGVRPEHIRLSQTGAGLPARVVAVQDQGNVRVLDVELAAGGRLKAKLPREQAIPAGEVRIVIPAQHAHIYADGVRADV
ncbi:ABC transporter ATP-binding protein [Aureimonas frigidaquae]|uniref:ABC sugar transporter n=1 Tax=Aureimonas frigidaquae TaxID=424757 RepID=A0A0P0Z452_9HYPH|nr:ABC transporter ATP-binding protein [Aureimonas frigidaquae]BAT28930.1 ABC sugar transporter [Aureimonas frigidaquae]